MPFVPAKCTQCGATIKVDDNKEAGICEFCGTAFITERAINNYNTYITNNFDGAIVNVMGISVDNYLELANAALEAKNGDDLLKYVDKALEVKPDSSEAWILKMKAMEYFSNANDIKLDETYTYGMNAIKYGQNENVKEEVYQYFLTRSLSLMIIALSKMKDTEATEKAFKSAGISLSGIALVQQTDHEAMRIFHEISRAAINFKLKVPDEFIKENDKIQQQIITIAKLYIEFCNADTERMKIYGLSPGNEAQEARKQNLSLIKRGLPSEKSEEVKAEDMKEGKDACYVATCVYGSYDCPQVWTLRRFRDYELDTTWYGRCFIKVYYFVSPTLVKWFGETEWFKAFWKKRLDKMIGWLRNRGFSDTRYVDKY